MAAHPNSFKARKTLKVGSRSYTYFSLKAVESQVGDLSRLWCSFRDGARIFGRAVTGDDLHAGMLLKPGRNRFGGAVGQQIDRPMGLVVDQDGAVHATTTQREIVDAEHARGRAQPG